MKNNFTDILRENLSIKDIINSCIPLVKKGNNYWACCPFHNEKTPSFSVNEEKGFYHCFGCGEHGDVISFYMKYKNIDFKTAITELSKIAKIKMPVFHKKNIKELTFEKNYFTIINEATSIYQNELYKNQQAIDYLKTRNFLKDTINKYKIGYAPNNNIITKKFINNKNIKDTGLIKQNENGTYDFFRDRLMFPLFDEENNIIAFSGRTLSNKEPKYLNTIDTNLFHKKKVLFGLNFAKNEIYKNNYSIIVEGQIDVIKMHQNGFLNTVAPLGTSITEEHIKKLCKINKNITFCFDGDEAGQKAAIRACSIVIKYINENSNFKFAFLPLNKDPDDILNSLNGKNILKNILDNALELTSFLWNIINKKFNTLTPSGKTKAEKYLNNELNQIIDLNYKYILKKDFQNKIFNSWYKWTTKNKEEPIKLNSITINKLNTIKNKYPKLFNKYTDIYNEINLNQNTIIEDSNITIKEAEIFLNNLILKQRFKYLNNKKKELLKEILNNKKTNLDIKNINEELENIIKLLKKQN